MVRRGWEIGRLGRSLISGYVISSWRCGWAEGVQRLENGVTTGEDEGKESKGTVGKVLR